MNNLHEEAPNAVPLAHLDAIEHHVQIGVEFWEEPSKGNGLVLLRKEIAERLECAGLEAVDLKTALARDLPVLSFLLTAAECAAVVTVCQRSRSSRRHCIWRLRHRQVDNLLAVDNGALATPRQRALRLCDEFVISFRRQTRECFQREQTKALALRSLG